MNIFFGEGLVSTRREYRKTALDGTFLMADWLGGRFTKVCVSVDSEAALDGRRITRAFR